MPPRKKQTRQARQIQRRAPAPTRRKKTPEGAELPSIDELLKSTPRAAGGDVPIVGTPPRKKASSGRRTTRRSGTGKKK